MGLAPFAAPDGAGRAGAPDRLAGELAVAPGVSVGIRANSAHTLRRNGVPSGSTRHFELPQLTREVGFELRDFAGEPGLVADPVGPRLQRFGRPPAGRVRLRRIAVRDGDVADRDLVPGDEQPSDGGFVQAYFTAASLASRLRAFEYAAVRPGWKTGRPAATRAAWRNGYRRLYLKGSVPTSAGIRVGWKQAATVAPSSARNGWNEDGNDT